MRPRHLALAAAVLAVAGTIALLTPTRPHRERAVASAKGPQAASATADFPLGTPSAGANAAPRSATSAASFAGSHRPAPATQTPRAAALPPFLAALRPDDPQSLHPVERATAAGALLAERWEPTGQPGHWQRLRLMRTPVQPRIVRIVDEWRESPTPGAAPVEVKREMFLADQLIVSRAATADPIVFAERLVALGLEEPREIAPGIYTVRTPEADLDSAPAALAVLTANPELFATASIDGVGFGGGSPDDTFYAAYQWNLKNIGQDVSSVVGTVGVDIGAEAFWEITTSAHGVVLAVLDSGLNYTHEDLQGLATHDSGELAGDGIDNDSNGFIDDVPGWDWVNNDNDPTDDHNHGSHVTGIILAKRNNAVGISGIIEGASLITAKILDASNVGLTSNLIAALHYARLRGAQVMNLSLQNYPDPQYPTVISNLNSAISACADAGILLVICAGNQGVNNDVTPNFPSSYPHANILSVGNHGPTGSKVTSSNYGATSVDLFAPGYFIRSTGRNGGWIDLSGTSMSAPHVAAIAAAILRVNPTWTATEVKAAILGSVLTAPAFAGISVTGGRLQALPALAAALRQQATNDTDGDGFANLIEYLTATRLDTASSRPELTLESIGNDLRLSVPRTLRSDALLEIEMSADLATWTTTGVVDESTSETLIGRITLGGTPPRGFLRLRAASVP